MAAEAQPRSEARRQFTQGTRVTLLEDDADRQDRALGSLSDRLDRIQAILVGILISLATGSVLMALNLLTRSK